MSMSFEKAVKGATKIKNAPPKAKYIERILVATHSDEAGIAEVFRTLQYRLRDSTWTVVFKGLLTIHIMIREGAQDVTLDFIGRHRNVLAISSFTDAQTQGRNIRRYSGYLTERGKAFRDTKVDWVRINKDKLEKVSVDKGLLRETETVLKQIMALLKCDLLDTEAETEITMAVFRLLVLDLLALFRVLNVGMIAILSQFFEMSKPDAERAQNIYKAFIKGTEYVVRYLSIARMHEYSLGMQIPSLEHAPTNLTKQLSDYLDDPDFEVHRRQYLAERQAKSNLPNKPRATPGRLTTPELVASKANRTPPQAAAARPVAEKKAAAAPPVDLIDFFDSIDSNPAPLPAQAAQQPIATSVITQGLPMAFQQQGPYQQQQQQQVFQQQQQGLMAQPTGFPANNPFGMPQQQAPGMFMPQQPQQPQFQMQPNPTGFAGFQSEAQGFQNFQPQGLQPLQPQHTQGGSTNPFRQSMMPPPMPTGSPFDLQQQQQLQLQQLQQQQQQQQQQQAQSTNPFARTQTGSPSPFQSAAPVVPLQAQPTGTNPFARNMSPPIQQQQQQQLVPQPTGVTNPFRQGDFVNHSTGMGWQHNQMPIGGGLDQIQTVPVFPRPAQQTPWQQ